MNVREEKFENEKNAACTMYLFIKNKVILKLSLLFLRKVTVVKRLLNVPIFFAKLNFCGLNF